ncbi:MAG: DnaA/Hda family protein [Pseudomonadota bacterium]
MDNDSEGRDADKAVFQKYHEALRGQVGDAKYKSWFLDLGLAERTRNSVIFSTPSQSKRDIIDHRFLHVMTEVWRRAIGPVDRISLTVRAAALSASAAKVNGLEARRANGSVSAAQSVAPGKSSPKPSLAAPLDPRRTFSTLAVGDSNRIAVAASRQALSSRAPAEIVYLYGESGVGKTHLLHAICHDGEAQKGDGSCLYVTYRNLINACVSAVLSNATQELHAAFMENDIVAIDDIHFLEGKDRTQEELLIVIDALLDSGKQVIIAGDRAPAKLAETGIKKRLADRLAGGLCATVHPADEEMRLEILKKRLQSSDAKCLIDVDVLEFIARHFSLSTRETIGALNQVLLLYRDEAVSVDLEEAKTVLRSRLQEQSSRRVASLEDAIIAGAEAFGLSVADIKGRAQPQRIVRARHAIVYCAREVLAESFPRIGKALNRDHTTAMSSYRRAQALYERDKAFQDGVARIREALEH